MAGTFDFTARKHFRGRITNERLGTKFVFPINPSGINEKIGSHIEEDPIPGTSDPKTGWSAGKGKNIRLIIELNAEITMRVNGASLSNGADSDYDPQTMSVINEIAFFEQFVFPGHPDARGDGADKVILTYGMRYQSVPCLLEDLEIDIIDSYPNGHPAQAKITMTMKRFVVNTVFAEDIFR